MSYGYLHDPCLWPALQASKNTLVLDRTRYPAHLSNVNNEVPTAISHSGAGEPSKCSRSTKVIQQTYCTQVYSKAKSAEKGQSQVKRAERSKSRINSIEETPTVVRASKPPVVALGNEATSYHQIVLEPSIATAALQKTAEESEAAALKMKVDEVETGHQNKVSHEMTAHEQNAVEEASACSKTEEEGEAVTRKKKIEGEEATARRERAKEEEVTAPRMKIEEEQAAARNKNIAEEMVVMRKTKEQMMTLRREKAEEAAARTMKAAEKEMAARRKNAEEEEATARRFKADGEQATARQKQANGKEAAARRMKVEEEDATVREETAVLRSINTEENEEVARNRFGIAQTVITTKSHKKSAQEMTAVLKEKPNLGMPPIPDSMVQIEAAVAAVNVEQLTEICKGSCQLQNSGAACALFVHIRAYVSACIMCHQVCGLSADPACPSTFTCAAKDERHYNCGHRRTTYDGYELPDLCNYLHLLKHRSDDPAALRKWRAMLSTLVKQPLNGKLCNKAAAESRRRLRAFEALREGKGTVSRRPAPSAYGGNYHTRSFGITRADRRCNDIVSMAQSTRVKHKLTVAFEDMKTILRQGTFDFSVGTREGDDCMCV